MAKNDFQQKMFQQFGDKALLESAQKLAYDYLDKALDRNVFPTPEAIEALKHFDESLPDRSCEGEDILQLLNCYGSPATVAQIGGRYFGFVNGGIVPVALAVKWLNDVWDQNTPLFVTSPINAKLEQVCQRWLNELLELPKDTVAGYVSGSSMAILCGLAAARYRIFKNLGWDINKQGFHGAPAIRIITSCDTHATVKKAISLLGFGLDNVTWVDTDDQGRIIVEKVPELDQSTILILQAGNVNTGSFDAFDELADSAIKANAWLHIDGAFGLWAHASASLKHLTKGINKANSWSLDGHKTLNTPYDNGIVLCNDKQALTNALQASGSYITYSDQRDGMLYTPEMSRRARAVELWATMKYLGRGGIEALVNLLHQQAKRLAKGLKSQGFIIHNDVVFNQVLVSNGNEAETSIILEQIQQSGVCWLAGSSIKSKKVIRVSICSWATSEDDIDKTIDIFVNVRDDVEANRLC